MKRISAVPAISPTRFACSFDRVTRFWSRYRSSDPNQASDHSRDPRAHSQFTIADPMCGTDEFLVAAYEWFVKATTGGAVDRDLAKRVARKTYFGGELVARPRRMALVDLFLHGVEPHIDLTDTIENPPAGKFDVILANPPFGTKGANAAPDRDDFTVSTSNQQQATERPPALPHRPETRRAGRRGAAG